MRTRTASQALSQNIKVSIEIQHTTCILSKQVEHTSKYPRITSNMDMVINGIHVHRVLKKTTKKKSEKERTWIVS